MKIGVAALRSLGSASLLVPTRTSSGMVSSRSALPRPRKDSICGKSTGRSWELKVNMRGASYLGESCTRTPFFRRKMMVRSEEHTSELQSLMRSSYAVFCLKKQSKLKMEKEH